MSLEEHTEEFKNWSGTLPYLKHSMNNRHLLKEGGRCIFCAGDVEFSKIEEWLDEQNTAICPHCGIDAVVPLSVLPREKGESEKLILEWRKLGFGQLSDNKLCDGCGMVKSGTKDCACWDTD